MGCLSLKHITASAPSASLGWVHRLREKGFSTLKAFSLLTVINKGREEPILFLRARLLTFCNAWGTCMEEKKKDSIQREENLSGPEYFPICPVTKAGQEQMPEQSIEHGADKQQYP